MATKEMLPLSVEWENGVISNELQEGVKPKYVIVEEGIKVPFRKEIASWGALRVNLGILPEIAGGVDKKAAYQKFYNVYGIVLEIMEQLGFYPYDEPITKKELLRRCQEDLYWSDVTYRPTFNSDWSSMSMVPKLRI